MSREKTETLEKDAITSEKIDTPPLDAPKLADVSEITSDLVADMPQPSDHAIAAKEIKETKLQNQYAEITDVNGDKFNPDIHRVDREGKPVISKKGKFFIKNGLGKTYSKPAVSEAKKSILGQAQVEAEKQQAELAARCRATGTTAGQILFVLTQSVIGEDLAPEKEARQKMVTDAFASYFQANNMPDLPPGWALVVAICAYIAPQLNQKPAQEKMKTIGAKFYLWLQNFKRKRPLEVREPENKVTNIPESTRGDN